MTKHYMTLNPSEACARMSCEQSYARRPIRALRPAGGMRGVALRGTKHNVYQSQFSMGDTHRTSAYYPASRACSCTASGELSPISAYDLLRTVERYDVVVPVKERRRDTSCVTYARAPLVTSLPLAALAFDERDDAVAGSRSATALCMGVTMQRTAVRRIGHAAARPRKTRSRQPMGTHKKKWGLCRLRPALAGAAASSWPLDFFTDFTSRVWLTYRSGSAPIRDMGLEELEGELIIVVDKLLEDERGKYREAGRVKYREDERSDVLEAGKGDVYEAGQEGNGDGKVPRADTGRSVVDAGRSTTGPGRSVYVNPLPDVVRARRMGRVLTRRIVARRPTIAAHRHRSSTAYADRSSTTHDHTSATHECTSVAYERSSSAFADRSSAAFTDFENAPSYATGSMRRWWKGGAGGGAIPMDKRARGMDKRTGRMERGAATDVETMGRRSGKGLSPAALKGPSVVALKEKETSKGALSSLTNWRRPDADAILGLGLPFTMPSPKNVRTSPDHGQGVDHRQGVEHRSGQVQASNTVKVSNIVQASNIVKVLIIVEVSNTVVASTIGNSGRPRSLCKTCSRWIYAWAWFGPSAEPLFTRIRTLGLVSRLPRHSPRSVEQETAYASQPYSVAARIDEGGERAGRRLRPQRRRPHCASSHCVGFSLRTTVTGGTLRPRRDAHASGVGDGGGGGDAVRARSRRRSWKGRSGCELFWRVLAATRSAAVLVSVSCQVAGDADAMSAKNELYIVRTSVSSV
ncbi:hypothetical protein BD626DRAFT_540363 [Schizophyllum amplum]|uniref:Uncharacterized protein n=1 Tax=Schizophyllum amplum TaxID=97359 RepID=A0A550BYS6_9AGAR|nr:hypothetical protein BD626DRAFT_540363 [Auriculariopsis ampla]